MKITLKAGDQVLGTANWDQLPVQGTTIPLRTADGLKTEARRVDKIEDDAAGGKIVHVGGPQPPMSYSPRS